MTRWEYFVFDDAELDQDELNEFGQSGWELSGFSSHQWSYENLRKGYTETGTSWTYIFKRPMIEVAE